MSITNNSDLSQGKWSCWALLPEEEVMQVIKWSICLENYFANKIFTIPGHHRVKTASSQYILISKIIYMIVHEIE